MDLSAPAWAAAGLLLGSVPFSVIVGRRIAGVDVRSVGDGNPGATNAARAAGRRAGILAALLDISKGVIPVALAVHLGGVTGAGLVLVMLAPVVGHCFSPFLGFRGGKGVATTYGVLVPVTLPFGPVVMPGLLLVARRLIEPDGWAAAATGLGVVVYVAVIGADPAVLSATVLAIALMVSRYRADLSTAPRLRDRGTRR